MKHKLKAANSTRIIGIDPGYAIVGYGILDYNGYTFAPVAYGSIQTAAGTPFEERLRLIWDKLCSLLQTYKPASMAVERLYFQNNQKTAIDVAQARGVILLSAVQHGVELFEYTPLQVKQAVVGYGKAEKRQVQQMTKTLLSLSEVPRPDDTADALAIAICHGHSAGSNASLQKWMKAR